MTKRNSKPTLAATLFANERDLLSFKTTPALKRFARVVKALPTRTRAEQRFFRTAFSLLCDAHFHANFPDDAAEIEMELDAHLNSI